MAEPVKVLEGLPKSSLIVLIAAKKVAEKASVFNYEAVYSKYQNYIKNHSNVGAITMTISKQVFLKLFVDLVHQGFIKSDGGSGEEGTAEILNVNNKVSLGFRKEELIEMLEGAKDRLGLPHQIMAWANH